MKDHLKVTALVLALLTVISLFAGCNKNKEDDTGMPAFVFKPEYNEAKINSEDFWLQGFATGSDAVYFWASVADGERERKYYDYDEKGNAIEQSYMSTTYVCRLFRADKDGKNAEMLPNFGISTDYTDEGAEERGVSMSSFFVTSFGKYPRHDCIVLGISDNSSSSISPQAQPSITQSRFASRAWIASTVSRISRQ